MYAAPAAAQYSPPRVHASSAGVVGDEQRRRAAAITELLGWIQLIISRCSSHPSGIARVSSANCIAFGCPPSIIHLLLAGLPAHSAVGSGLARSVRRWRGPESGKT